MRKKVQAESLLAVLFFAAVFLIGLFVFDDYGLSWDETMQRKHSIVSYAYLNKVLLDRNVYKQISFAQSEAPVESESNVLGQFAAMDPGEALRTYNRKYYGVALQLPLACAEDVYAQITGEPMPLRSVYLMRHFYVFTLYFLALLCFYFLLKRMFSSGWLALCGVAMIALFGHFFAQSFYNIKDMLFASVTMVALSLAERIFASERKLVWCVLFAVAGALLVSVRTNGALLIAFVLIAMLWQDIARRRTARAAGAIAAEKKPVLSALLPYAAICLSVLFWVLITPAAWERPLRFALGYVTTFSNYSHWRSVVAFAGRLIPWNVIPRGYLITWILLTVPILNQLFCLLGMTLTAFSAVRPSKSLQLPASAAILLRIMFVTIAGTLGYQYLAHTVVYNGWRHVYFLYPMMIAFAVYALWWLLGVFRAKGARAPRIALIGAVAVSLCFNAVRIAKDHPYQYAMMNVIGRTQALEYDRDYWQLSQRQAFEYLAANVSGTIRFDFFCKGESRFVAGQEILPKADCERIVFSPDDPDYMILDCSERFGSNEFPVEGFTEIYAVWADGVKLMSVQKRIGLPG